MSHATSPPATPQSDTPQSGPDRPRRSRRQGDRVFRGLSTGAALIILVTLAAVTIFLVVEGIPALTADPAEVSGGRGFWRLAWPLLFGTVLAALIGLVVAVPLSLGIALFISHYAPRRIANVLGYLIDLLAAVPSIVFGLWGITVFAPYLVPVYQWLERHAGWIPLFAGPASGSGRTMLTAGLVLGVMILPIMTAVARETFLQTPRLHQEAALALGATRWEMITLAVLPYGRGGVISGAMLGLGRALGETIAVTLILSVSPGLVTANLIGNENPSTIAANIALNFPEATGLRVNELIATGLVLFVLTFFVNFLARRLARAGFGGAAV